ncbi:MAG: hypothetical protein IJJ82_01430 [Clostridia bacterium]|nr:hypothetical protein [Clostridia bacterium]
MFRDKLKFLKPQEDGNDKKKIENLVFFVIILIITIIAINIVWSDNDSKKKSKDNINDTTKQLASTTMETSSDIGLEQKLKNILETIQGVGKVNVFINYSESSETVAMFNENSKTSTTEETDTSGGKRIIEQKDTQKDVVYQDSNGDKIPITQKTIQPKIEGAIITAEGAGNASVKACIIQAVEAATGLATHKIQVFKFSQN